MKNEKLKMKNLGKSKFFLAKKFAYRTFSFFNFPFAFVSKRGFTLLETVVALAILSAAIVGPMSLVSRGISGARASKNLTAASYLAEEGMEIVRGIKENNALAGSTGNSGDCNNAVNWNYGLCAGVWRANISTLTLESGAGNPLLFDPGSPGLYNYQSGNSSMFTREVVIASLVSPADDEVDSVSGLTVPAADILDITVTVSWREGPVGVRDVILRERLYNW